MRKPLHWKNQWDENQNILSAVALLHPHIIIWSVKVGLSKEEMNSVLWGLWSVNSKELRPHVYSLQKEFSKLFFQIIDKVKNQRVGKTNIKNNTK